MLTRIAGVALLPALAVMAWRRPERWRALASLCVAPLDLRRVPAVPRDPARDDALRLRALAGLLEPAPLARRAARRHLGRAARGVGRRRAARLRLAHARLLDARPGHRPDARGRGQPRGFAFLVLFVALTVIAWRRFGAPYGLFCAVSLAIPLSVPSQRWPLLSMPRFGLVLFPCFLALAVLGGRPRVHTAILVVSSIMLGVAVTQWALWQWVA